MPYSGNKIIITHSTSISWCRYNILCAHFSSLVKKTEGFSPKDLGSLLDRAFHKAAIRKLKNQKGKLKFKKNITRKGRLSAVD